MRADGPGVVDGGTWTRVVTAVAVALLVLSVLRTDPLVLAVMVVVVVGHAILFTWGIRRQRTARLHEPGVVATGTRMGLLVVASLQLMTVSTAFWFACAVLVVATSPWARRTLVRLAPGRGEGEPAVDLRELSDEDLVQVWHSSAHLLAGPLQPATRCRLVAQRAEYLDELERRQPDRVRAWLAAASYDEPS